MKLHSKNIVSLFGFDALARLLGFASTTYLARTLGNGTFGVINLGLAVFSYGLITSSPGLHIIATRIVAQRSMNDAAVIRRVTALRLTLACLTCAAAGLASFVFIHDTAIRCIIVLYSASLIPAAFQIEWYFQARQDIASLGGSRSASLLAFVVILILVVRSEADLFLVPVAYFLSTTLNAAILYFIYTKTRGDANIAGETHVADLRWSSLLRQSLPVGAAVMFGQAVLNFPVILLGIFATASDIGNFSAASKFVFFLLVVDRAVYILFYPLVARTFAAAPGEVGRQVGRILNYMLIASLPICAGVVVLARPLTMLIFGAQFVDSVALLQILVFYFLFTILNSIFAFVVIASGREKHYSAIIVSVSSLLLVALVPLTYCWGAAGASTGMVAGEFCMMALMFRQCRKSVSTKLPFNPAKAIVCSALMGGVLYLLPHTPLYFSVPIGIVVYAGAMILLKGIAGDDILFLRERLL